MDMGERLDTCGTWVTHRATDKRVDIEVTSAVIGSDTVWGAQVVLERGRRVKLAGGKVPVGVKFEHHRMLQAAQRQAQALPAGVVLGTGGESGDLFG